MKTLQPKDFRQGKTFYAVMAFPYRNQKDAEVREVRVASRPFMKPGIGIFFKQTQTSYFDGKPYTAEHSLRDAGVIPNVYNMHRTFHTRKQAQRYADRMNAGRLTYAESIKCKMLRRRDSCDMFEYGVFIEPDEYKQDYGSKLNLTNILKPKFVPIVLTDGV